MLRSIQKLIGDKRKQLIFPIFLMSLDAIGSLVMYLMLYFTVIHLLNGSLTGGLVRNYTIVCLISIILRLIIYRSGYFLCFSRGAEMCSGLRLDLANHYRSLSLGYFNQNSSGYLLSTLTKDLSNFELVLTHTLPSIVKTLVMGCLILVGTFFINWKLALAECVVILIALPVLNWGNRLVEKYGTIKRDLTSKMISIVLEYIKGMKVFKSANMTSTHFTRMSDTLEDIRKTSVQAEVKTAAPTSMYSIIANFLLPFVLLIGSYLFLGGTIASELLVAFMLMSLALSALLIAFEHSYNLLKELKLATSNLEQAFDTKPLSYKEEKVKLSHFDITFENVDFSYNQQTDVLHNISFHAPEGSTTALIGPSGSGKSTVANLIARFWDVTKGCVRIGGQDIRELNPDGLLHYISEVFQENTLLSDTIYNNIKAGREDATEQEVIAAAKAAHFTIDSRCPLSSDRNFCSRSLALSISFWMVGFKSSPICRANMSAVFFRLVRRDFVVSYRLLASSVRAVFLSHALLAVACVLLKSSVALVARRSVSLSRISAIPMSSRVLMALTPSSSILDRPTINA